jgi:Uncharacterized protein conserved in bacteria (DUF2252)
MNVEELTGDYEAWLAQQIPVVPEDIEVKHEQLASSPLRFLRGTYYLWLDRMVTLLPKLMNRSRVVAVGDLHAENFGVWRDRHGVHRWGVNDLDELAWAPYPVDLVRLATSVALVPECALPTKRLCLSIMDSWNGAPDRPAQEIGEDQARHLRNLLPEPKPADEYFADLARAPAADPADVPSTVRAAVLASVRGEWVPTWHVRRAGTGSRGHPRVVAVSRRHAREAKLLGPGTAVWARARLDGPVPEPDPTLYGRVVEALHGAGPSLRRDGWQIRRLAPDVARIRLDGLSTRDCERLVRTMAEAVAGVHGIDGPTLASARADIATLDEDWLRDAVEAMVADTRDCYRQWRDALGFDRHS